MNLAEIFSGPLTPAKWRALGEHLTGGIVRGGPGVRIRQVGNKVLVSAKRRFGGGTPAGATCSGFRLSNGAESNLLDVSESTIIGQTPTGFTEGKKTFTIATVDGKIYGKIIIAADGVPGTAEVLQGETVPADTGTAYHREIGTFHVEGTGESAVLSFTQTNCGPLDATVCRNWFASEAPFYGVSWL